VAIEEARLELALQDVFDRATAPEQERYLELMRHDPIAGMAYLEALSCSQGQISGSRLRATEDLDREDVVPCPHCGGVLLGRWEEHQAGCPAISTEHACGKCEEAMDDFAKRRL
jgi:hypothetical protein